MKELPQEAQPEAHYKRHVSGELLATKNTKNDKNAKGDVMLSSLP
jgi:hypothetical protein